MTNKLSIGVDEAQPRAEQNVLTVTINTKDVVRAKQDGGDLVFNPRAENAILKLLEMQKLIEDAIAYVQSEIEQQGLAYNENFTSVAGDLVKANYSASGARYKADLTQVKHPQKPFWKREVKYSVVADEVEKYEMKHRGKLPKGISKPVRNKKIQFKLKDV